MYQAKYSQEIFSEKLGMGKLSKVVIPVAGLGTRMLPSTKVIPKEMLPIVDKPIQYIVEEVIEAGITKYSS